jgi:predicted transcriptional regulator
VAAPVDRLDELVRLITIQLRRGSASQASLAQELSRAGFRPARIAELLGTTTATVTTDLDRAKKSSGAPKRASTKPATARTRASTATKS